MLRTLNWRGFVFVFLGLAGVWVGLQAAEYRPFGVALAMFSFFLAGSFLGKSGRLAAALAPLVGRTVRVEVWGMPLPEAGDALFDINSITGFGASLLLHLLPESGGPGSVLKVAQPAPRGSRTTGSRSLWRPTSNGPERSSGPPAGNTRPRWRSTAPEAGRFRRDRCLRSRLPTQE